MLFKVITTIAVTVPVFVLAAQTPDGIAIPLTKRSDTDAREFHITSHNAKIIRGPSSMDGSDRNEGTPHPSAVKRVGYGAGVDLKPYMDRMWYGTLSIGTPPRYFTVQFSTGSSDLFVPASTGDQNCRSHHNLWDLTPSQRDITNSDLNIGFTAEFSNGWVVRGKQFENNVTIAGFTADIQTIGAATIYSSNMAVSQFPPDGILGLAFPSSSVLHGQSPLLHTLFNEGKLSQPIFSLRLTSSGGELYVGGTNEALYMPITLVFTPVRNPEMGLWALMIDNIQVNGEIVLTDVTAIVDTGCHFIIGDPKRVLAVHKAAGGGSYEGGGGFYTFPCQSFPSMTFTIGGRPFFMPATDLNEGWVAFESHDCFSGIAAVENLFSGFWSIGTIFLQQFYTVFDFNSVLPRVGFAELAHGL